jgi:adenosylhomocysteine nucleosidase
VSDAAIAPSVTGIVVALPEELQTLTKAKLKRGECREIRAGLWVCYSGAGLQNAEKAAQRLIEAGANRLISWGCAAALQANLSAGDLVLPVSVSFRGASLQTDADWLHDLRAKVAPLQNPIVGVLLHSDVLVADQSHKRRLFSESAAVALDMESAGVLRIAGNAGMPALVIRTIADTADFDLPEAVALALDEQGQVRLPKLLGHLLRHPAQLPGLIKLGRYFQAAQTTLRRLSPLLDAVA